MTITVKSQKDEKLKHTVQHLMQDYVNEFPRNVPYAYLNKSDKPAQVARNNGMIAQAIIDEINKDEMMDVKQLLLVVRELPKQHECYQETSVMFRKLLRKIVVLLKFNLS